MLQRYLPLPVKLICGLIYSDETIYRAAKTALEKKFGKIDFESRPIDFDFTDYYEKEMGKPLFRRFISFERLRKADEFVSVKLSCIKIEKKYSVRTKRTINIDPGYINEAKLVLTTTKDFSHRIYLRRGIFAEVTLIFNKGRFFDFSTTFPDYRTSRYKDIFVIIRRIYSGQVKKKQA